MMRYILPILLISGSLFTGCAKSGPNFIPVTGKVTLDGAPVAGASVMFMPVAGGSPAEGVTDAQGVYRLTTLVDKPREGAVEGEHVITVSGVRTVGGAVAEDGTQLEAKAPQLEYFVPMRYAKGDTSGLRATVSEGFPPYDLELFSK